VVGGVRSLFDRLQLLLRSIRFLVSEVDFFAGQRFVSGDLPLALISQFVCHNFPVPGFTDGAGFRFGWVRQLLRSVRFLVSEVGLGTEAALFVCDDVVKTENLDWIFLLDVSLPLRLACGRISIVEYVR
jgi:hypothetical protein